MRSLSAAWRVHGGLVVLAVLTSGCAEFYQEHPFNKFLNSAPHNRMDYGNLRELESVVDAATGQPIDDARCLVARAPATYEHGWAGHPMLRGRGKAEFLVYRWSDLKTYAYLVNYSSSFIASFTTKQYDHWLFVLAKGYQPVYLEESSRYYRKQAPGQYEEAVWPGVDVPLDPTCSWFRLYPRTVKLTPAGSRELNLADLAALVKTTLPEGLWTNESAHTLTKTLGSSP